ncbi:SDR family NAD(P)-dependent oxidoreductase [Pelagibacterium montanilacus]|uniref:SDR family NAD(P)-dependent oxidoreductase n=1 Tax=Pelagibacterium montanilacus TaxID=2185280 RepID=UPI000F8EB779|nr:SDR family oxidoreductase [Pelagibacterium montanilacus]
MSQMFDLSGRTALVTGGGRGLGKAMAHALAGAGARVAIAGRNAEERESAVAEITALGGEAIALAADLLEPQGPERLVDEADTALGGLDILIHAAGHQIRKPLVELAAEEWDQIAAIHSRAAFLLARETVLRLRARNAPGRIIFIGSLNSHIGIANVGAYASAKSGLAGLARVLSAENAAHAITVNTIIPGYFHTALTSDLFADPERHAWVMSRIPMKRLGRPEDLGGAAVFLASSASDYVTGAEIRVDGGWLAT